MSVTGVYKILDELSVNYEEFRHPPVFTVEEANTHWKDIHATHCKNLFFRDKKGRRHFLVVMRSDLQLDIKLLAEKIGAGRLSFGSEERLMRCLKLTPGSVSPFGLLNDKENQVEVYLDNTLRNAQRLGFHPNDNSITITITAEDFIKFLDWSGNKYTFIDL